MAVEAKITNRLDNNFVQVEMKAPKSERISYYKVPTNKADAFITEYKKNDKKSSIITNTAFVGAIFGGVLVANSFTKKLKNKVLAWLINTGAGILGATGAVILSSSYLEKSQNKIMEKFQAQKINQNV